MKIEISKIFHPQIIEVGGLLLSIILGVYLRIQPLKWGRLWAYDPYYFWRAATHIANGGSIFDTDPMIVTLHRRFIDDEPVLPLVWGYISKLFHISTLTVGLYLPIVIFVLEVLLLYKLLRDAFNWRVGVIASLFLAIVPGHIYRTHGGGIWKDTLGSLFMLMFLHAAVLIVKSRKLTPKKMVIYGFYLMVSLFLSAATFDGFGAFPAGISLYLIFSPLVSSPRKNEFFLAGCMIPPLLLAYIIPTYHRETYTYIPFITLAVGALVAIVVFRLLFDSFRKGKILYALLLAVTIGISFWIVLFNPPEILNQTSRTLWMLISPEKYGASAQSRPNSLGLLFNTWFSFALLLSPLGVVHLGLGLKSSGRRVCVLFLSLLSVLIFLGVSTVRLTYIMSFGIVVLSALGIELIFETAAKKLDRKIAAAIVVVVLFATSAPTFAAGKDYVSMHPVPSDYWLNALEWMHNNINGSVVFNWWDWGYWLEAYGMKTVGDNGYQSGLTYSGYANVILSNYSKFEYWVRRYNRTVQTISLRRCGENDSIEYLVIGFDVFFKYPSIERAYGYPYKKIKFLILRLNIATRDSMMYKYGNVVLYLTAQRAKLSVEGREIKVRDVVYEIPSSYNKIIHVSNGGTVVYINGPYAIIFNKDALNSTFVQLFVYENQQKARLVWENGLVKIYKPLT